MEIYIICNAYFCTDTGGWAKHNLRIIGLLETVSRGRYRITEDGLKSLHSPFHGIFNLPLRLILLHIYISSDIWQLV